MGACGDEKPEDDAGSGVAEADADWRDQDVDGYPDGEDCNDDDPSVNPGAIEVLWRIKSV